MANVNIVTKFQCSVCKFSSNYKTHYDRHVLSSKHKKATAPISTSIITEKKKESYACPCGRTYSTRPGLSRHKRTCTWTPPLDPLSELILQNNLLKEMIVKLLHVNVHILTTLREDENSISTSTAESIIQKIKEDHDTIRSRFFRYMIDEKNKTPETNALLIKLFDIFSSGGGGGGAP